MVDESIRRAVCEACGWRFEQIGDAPVVWAGIIPPDNGHRYPWSDNGDAIAALEAFCNKNDRPGYEYSRFEKLYEVGIYPDEDVQNISEEIVETEIAEAADLPTAACEAISAAWSKMKEREDA